MDCCFNGTIQTLSDDVSCDELHTHTCISSIKNDYNDNSVVVKWNNSGDFNT